MITWELRLYDQHGARVATFVDWPDLAVTRQVNAPCVYALRLNGDDARVALFDVDGILEGWWCDPEDGIAWRREFTAWTIDRRKWTDEAGVKWFESSGFGLEHLLARDIIDAAAGSAASRKSGAGETVLKDFADEQCGPGAGARARDGLVIELDHSPALGSSWSGQRSNRQALEVVQEIALATGLQFGIERTDDYEFELRVWEPEDRRETVIFSEERANMGEPYIIQRYSRAVTRVKVAGAGQGAARDVIYMEDAALAALSPQMRYEQYVDARDQESNDEYTSRGQAVLDGNEELIEFGFTVRQTAGCLYGAHYGLGDMVTARYDGVDYPRRVDKVVWRLNKDTVLPEVETVEARVDGS